MLAATHYADERPTLPDLEAQRAALERALQRAARSAGLTEHAARSVAADACRLDDTGGDMGVKEMLAELSDRDRDRVRSLAAAIARIDAGRYGTCSTCGGAIARERLEVMPETPTCRTCAE